MSQRSIEGLRRELDRLMRDQAEDLKKQTFGGLQPRELRELEERLNRIRELSADYLAALKRQLERPASKESAMAQNTKEKPAVTMPGKVDRIIETPDLDEPEKAQISIEGADTLYKEIRIENELIDEKGKKVRLKEGAEVDVTVEAGKDATEPKQKEK